MSMRACTYVNAHLHVSVLQKCAECMHLCVPLLSSLASIHPSIHSVECRVWLWVVRVRALSLSLSFSLSLSPLSHPPELDWNQFSNTMPNCNAFNSRYMAWVTQPCKFAIIQLSAWMILFKQQHKGDLLRVNTGLGTSVSVAFRGVDCRCLCQRLRHKSSLEGGSSSPSRDLSCYREDGQFPYWKAP